MCLRVFYHIFVSSDAYLNFVTDDFYYYFLPAKHFVEQGISSFDGVTITNGYHPLWMLFLSALNVISFGNEQLFFGLLAIVCAFSTYFTFRCFWIIAHKVFPTNRLIPVIILPVVVVFGGLIFLGMEITLTIPLYAYLLWTILQLDFNRELTIRTSLTLGILSSLLILSRLDTGILIGLFLIFILISYKLSAKQLLAFGTYFVIGGILLPLYFLLNYYWFGHLMTVSSSAKTLSDGNVFDFSSLKHLALNRDGIGGLLLIPFGIAALFLKGNRQQPISHRIVCFLVLLFPVFFYGTVLVNSSWFLNRWYFYPLPFCTFITIALLTNGLFSKISERKSRLIRRITMVIISALTIIFSVVLLYRDTVRWQLEPNSLYIHAKGMLSFTKSHPGIYGMGDRAGLTAYILKIPIIQLEGLNADFKMRDHIQRQDELLSVLKSYHIDYLIETTDKEGLPKEQNCYKIEEPHSGQAGQLSKKMRGLICSEPIFSLTTGNPNEYQVKTYIFDLKK